MVLVGRAGTKKKCAMTKDTIPNILHMFKTLFELYFVYSTFADVWEFNLKTKSTTKTEMRNT